MENKKKVSILILTHNAALFIYKVLTSLRMTKHVNYEVIIVDNRSSLLTRLLLLLLHYIGWTNKLCFLDYNSLFAAGNNRAACLSDPKSSHFLLLNSDVEIRHADWLKVLLDNHEYGITSFGVVIGNPVSRVDGYCLLIDRELYLKHQLDESYQWWWSVTGLQAKVLSEGYSVKGFNEHEKYLHHFGGKSGSSFKVAKGMDVDPEEVVSWFHGRTIRIFDSPNMGKPEALN